MWVRDCVCVCVKASNNSSVPLLCYKAPVSLQCHSDWQTFIKNSIWGREKYQQCAHTLYINSIKLTFTHSCVCVCVCPMCLNFKCKILLLTVPDGKWKSIWYLYIYIFIYCRFLLIKRLVTKTCCRFCAYFGSDLFNDLLIIYYLSSCIQDICVFFFFSPLNNKRENKIIYFTQYQISSAKPPTVTPTLTPHSYPHSNPPQLPTTVTRHCNPHSNPPL